MPKLTAELLAVLRCPVTGSSLVQEGEELVSTAADSSGRPVRYGLVESIPVLLPQARLAAPSGSEGRPTAPDPTAKDVR